MALQWKKAYIRLRGAFCILLLTSGAVVPALAGNVNPQNHSVLIRDITSVEGVRDNMLVGYGLVVGLDRTGDSLETYFTVQTLANAMQRMGVLISPGIVQVRNVAAVFITASLPPFARPGEKIDVTVSSTGDATSLLGGVLLMSALHGSDGKVYAEAEGPLVVGGYSAGNSLNSKEVNSPDVGIVPNGGIVERNTAVDLDNFKTVSLLLRNPDFTTAQQVAEAINHDFQRAVATVVDSSRVDVSVTQSGAHSVPMLISRVQNLSLVVHTPARIIVNERTGTIVLGGAVKLTPVSVIHGNLSIQVVTTYTAAPVPNVLTNIWNGGGGGPEGRTGGGQGPPPPGGMGPGGQNLGPGRSPGQGFTGGVGAILPQTALSANDSPAESMQLDNGANVQELVNGLHAIGATARDVISILEAIKAEGGIQADLEVQ